MYTANELKNLIIKPRINDITLEVLREFYEMFLHPFIFTYQIANDKTAEVISLKFNTNNFCHLLGIESIVRGTIKYDQLYNYRGDTGWDNIKKGILDIPHLKNLNKRNFQNVKAKYVYFYLIPTLLENPLAINYDKDKIFPPTNIDCEILFYNTYENAVIHLGIKRDLDDPDFYIPRTFFVEKLKNGAGKDIYIENQASITVLKKDRIIML